MTGIRRAPERGESTDLRTRIRPLTGIDSAPSHAGSELPVVARSWRMHTPAWIATFGGSVSVSPSPVAFSTLEPVRAPTAFARQHPMRFAAPVAVLLLPLPLLGAVAWSLATGPAGAPLQVALAGFPAPASLLLEPLDAADWRAFAALLVVGVAMVTTVAAAGLVGGAAARSREPRQSLEMAIRRWPSLALLLFAQILVLAVALASVMTIAWCAGQLRFQLQTVVLLVGCGALSVVAVRLSLWPAFVLDRGLSPFAAIRRSWTRSRGSATRLVAAAFGVLATAALIAVAAQKLTALVLTELADAGAIGLSPLTIDLWSLLPWPIVAITGAAVWGHAAPSLADALERWTPPASPERGQRSSGG